jgi:hypothetical protein
LASGVNAGSSSSLWISVALSDLLVVLLLILNLIVVTNITVPTTPSNAQPNVVNPGLI